MKKSDIIDYEIIGDTLQAIEIELDPYETVIAEAGAMLWMEEGIEYEAKMGDGTQPKQGFFDMAWGAGKRMLMGESLFLTHFTNKGQGKKKVAFSAPYPGTIEAIDLSELGEEGVLVQKNAFLCAAKGTKLEMAFQKKIGVGLFGGEGFIMERLIGDGMAFIHAGGTLITKELSRGEKLRVDTGCIVAIAGNIEFDIERAGNLKTMIFGGEGLFLATLEGEGVVVLQSLPFSKLADTIIQNAPRGASGGGNSTGNGSILGGFADIFEN